MYTYTCICMYKYMYMYIYIYMCVCVCVCIDMLYITCDTYVLTWTLIIVHTIRVRLWCKYKPISVRLVVIFKS